MDAAAGRVHRDPPGRGPDHHARPRAGRRLRHRRRSAGQVDASGPNSRAGRADGPAVRPAGHRGARDRRGFRARQAGRRRAVSRPASWPRPRPARPTSCSSSGSGRRQRPGRPGAMAAAVPQLTPSRPAPSVGRVRTGPPPRRGRSSAGSARAVAQPLAPGRPGRRRRSPQASGPTATGREAPLPPSPPSRRSSTSTWFAPDRARRRRGPWRPASARRPRRARLRGAA